MNERGKEGVKRIVFLVDGIKNSEVWIFVLLIIF